MRNLALILVPEPGKSCFSGATTKIRARFLLLHLAPRGVEVGMTCRQLGDVTLALEERARMNRADYWLAKFSKLRVDRARGDPARAISNGALRVSFRTECSGVRNLALSFTGNRTKGVTCRQLGDVTLALEERARMNRADDWLAKLSKLRVDRAHPAPAVIPAAARIRSLPQPLTPGT